MRTMPALRRVFTRPRSGCEHGLPPGLPQCSETQDRKIAAAVEHAAKSAVGMRTGCPPCFLPHSRLIESIIRHVRAATCRWALRAKTAATRKRAQTNMPINARHVGWSRSSATGMLSSRRANREEGLARQQAPFSLNGTPAPATLGISGHPMRPNGFLPPRPCQENQRYIKYF